MTFLTEPRTIPLLLLRSFRAIGSIWRYAFAVLAVGLAIGITWIFDFLAPGRPNLFFFFAAIMASAWFAGPIPGWISVVLSIWAADYIFIEPVGTFDLYAKDIPWLMAFVICSIVANALSLQRRRVEAQLRQAQIELEHRVEQRTVDLRKSNEGLIKATAKRVQVETELRKSQAELARIGRIMTVGECAASIAHELNQPLGAIMANGEAALNWLQQDPPELVEVATSVDGIVAAGQRASDIIDKIRSLVARRPTELTAIDINELVSSVFELTQMGFKKTDIGISFHLQSNLPRIRGDRIQLQHVMLNLLNNAIEAMVDVPSELAQLHIYTERAPDNCVAIVVEDYGNGFDGADSSRIFEPFYSTKETGMGMGLSICRTIVRQHGGRIGAVPRSPQGVTFRITLPAGAHDEHH